MKQIIRKFIPEILIVWYHHLLAYCAVVYYRNPTSKLAVVGITGTKGKTSTANFVWSVLSSGGYKTGLIGTANIRIGSEERMNKYHMTMPGPFVLQKLFREMVNAGCTHVVLEATSEGMKLGRHIGISFDIAIFTNLTPEHLPSHGGSFEKYKEKKSLLFKTLNHQEKKVGNIVVPSCAIINGDDPHGTYYASFFPMVTTYGIRGGQIHATHVEETPGGVSFWVDGVLYAISILGRFNVYNALPALAVGRLFGISTDAIARGLSTLALIPGRMELVAVGQPFTVIVDYAHEKTSMNALLNTAQTLRKDNARIIILFGAQGGGRDKEKRKWMGYAAAEKAEYVILTSDDSYEERPESIIADIAIFVTEKGKREGYDLFSIPDRREAIRKAFALAHPHDIVIVAGRGAEQAMVENGKKIPFDDRVVAREELARLGFH